MNNSSLSLAARLSLDNQRYVQGLAGAQSHTRGFASAVKNEFGELNRFLSGTTAKLASYGAGFALGAQIVKSAGMDKSLGQLALNAGAGAKQVKALRGELFQMAAETGRNVDDLQQGVGTFVAAGLKLEESLASMPAVNRTMAVTNATAETLAGTLGVASTAFKFDLSKPKTATALLDQMTVAGRKGNAELENLGGIFSRVGVNAGRAGFGFEQTLAFIEGLSLIERQPERLATLADSTLRLFTNAKYMADAQKATGVKFFENGSRRDPMKVLADMRGKMAGMKTDADRERFLTKAFGNADLDTIKGMSTLLQGDSLDKINQFTAEIKGASGTIERDLPAAINNAVDVSARLKARMRDAADAFAQPINALYTKLGSKALGDGGKTSGLSNAGLIGSGVGLLASAYLLKRVGGAALGRVIGGAGSLAGGVAMGTALEKAGAATPVFIVGAAPGVMSGGGGNAVLDTATGAVLAKGARGGLLKGARGLLARGLLAGGSSVGSLAGAGTAGASTLAGGVLIAGAAGWGVGTGFNRAIAGTAYGDRVTNHIGTEISKLLALLGNREARANLESMKLDIDVDVSGMQPRVTVRGKDFQSVTGSSTARTGRRASGGGR